MTPATIQADPSVVAEITTAAGQGDDSLTVDFSGGNPLANRSLWFDGGPGNATLNLDNGAGLFTSESYMLLGAGAGYVDFSDGSGVSAIKFSALTQINDSVPVASYDFHAPDSPAFVEIDDGPSAGGMKYATIQSPSNPPAFAPVNYAGKGNVTVSDPGQNDNILLDNPTLATGQTTLTLNLGVGSDTVEIEANPAGAATSIEGGGGNNLITVAGSGLATGYPPSSLTIDGGTGATTLRADAQQVPASLANSGTIQFGSPLGGPRVNYAHVADVQVLELPASPSITPAAVSAVRNEALSDAVVATFSCRWRQRRAGQYAATIAWGDGSTTAGAIAFSGTSVGFGPATSTFVVTGRHVYSGDGPDSITVTVTPLGSTVPSLVPGTSIPVAVDPAPGCFNHECSNGRDPDRLAARRPGTARDRVGRHTLHRDCGHLPGPRRRRCARQLHGAGQLG